MRNLLERLEEYSLSDYYPFHMPGHKRNMPREIGVLERAASMDLTEIEGFDNLHRPEGILREARERAASVFGAQETFFLVNGSTAGVLTALSAAARQGSRVVVARNCHYSVYHAMYLRRMEPVYLYPGVVKGWGIADAILPQQVEEALMRYPDTAAVILTSPTYDGVLSDVEAVAEAAHRRGIPLIVDAAHGAHLGFARGWPESPVRQGADLVIQSLHKTLPALTQTALLHVSGERVDRERLRRFEEIYQTSSPSYLLMGSIDACVQLMQTKGRQIMEDFSLRLDEFHAGLSGLERIVLSGREILQQGRMKDFDRGKLLIAERSGRLCGGFLYQELLERYHLQMEMAGDSYVTAILTPWDREEGLMRLSEALWDLDRRIAKGRLPETAWTVREGGKDGSQPYPALEPSAPLYEALEEPETLWPLREAAGRSAGGYVNLYPPGIPLAVPGEILTEEMIKRLVGYARQGLNVQGLVRTREGRLLIPVLAPQGGFLRKQE